jgi:peroxiredoxin
LNFPFRAVAAGAAAVFLLTGCATSPSAHAAALKPAKDRKAAPDFVLKDVNGKPLKLSDYKGKVVLLNFWATWCGPCKIEIPWFKEFETNLKNRGFAVVGVAMDDEGWEVVKPYLEKQAVNYRVVMGNDQVSIQYGNVDSLPTTFLIDKEGKIASIHIGLVSKGDYAAEIEQLLK